MSSREQIGNGKIVCFLTLLGWILPLAGIAFALAKWPHIQGDRSAIDNVVLRCGASVLFGLLISGWATFRTKRLRLRLISKFGFSGVVLSASLLGYAVVSVDGLFQKIEGARETYREENH